MIGGCTDLPTTAPDFIHMLNQDTLVNAGAVAPLLGMLGPIGRQPGPKITVFL
jgi:hypothetical protein